MSNLIDPGGGNNELQCYTDNRWENARQENGNLIIQARWENIGNVYSKLKFLILVSRNPNNNVQVEANPLRHPE